MSWLVDAYRSYDGCFRRVSAQQRPCLRRQKMRIDKKQNLKGEKEDQRLLNYIFYNWVIRRYAIFFCPRASTNL